MANTDELQAERQRRLERVIAAFLEAVDTGRDDDPVDWLARHPDLNPELAEFFEDQAEFLRLIGPIQPREGAIDDPGGEDVDPAWDELHGSGSELPGSGPVPVRTGDRYPRGSPMASGADPTLAIHSAGAPHAAARDRATRPPKGTAVRYFGDYELREMLGQGGMGVVYAARQISLNRPVALKMIRAGRFSTEDERRRFQNEAETVATLDHPNIVPIHEVGRHRQLSFFTMKLIAGGNLLELVARARPEPRTAARLTITIAEAVHHAHQRGVLHRDLKPANILIDEHGQPHVTDFGLARRLADESSLTQSDAILGTPAFMAPEQAAGKRAAATVASDVYGIGGILYVLLSGQSPFQGDTALDTLDLVRHQPPVPPSKLNRQVPRDLEIICLKCLDKDPNRRYASARELADDLGRWLEGRPITARRVGPWTRLVLWCRRNPALAGLQLMVVLGSLAISLNWHLAVQRRAAAAAALEITSRRLIAAENARNEAQSEAEESSRVLNFLLNELGDVLSDLGRYDQAESLFRELLRMLLNRDLMAASIRLQLGRCLIELKRFDEAESLLAEAQERLAVARGERPVRDRLRSQARKLFVSLYEAWGKPAEAARWRDQPPDEKPHPKAHP